LSGLGAVAVAGSCALGDAPSTWLEGLLHPRATSLVAPVNPGVDALAWRRMSRLSRAAIVAAHQVLERRGVSDRDRLPVIWATGLGELGVTEDYLRTLLLRGRGRPRAFRASVHNTAASHLALTLGLRGPSETIAGGWATASAALVRARALVRRHGRALVVGGDDESAAFQAALAPLGGRPARLCVAALLLEGGGEGAPIAVEARGAPPDADGRPLLAVSSPLTRRDEAPSAPLHPAVGECPAQGLVGVAALVAGGGGRLVERSGDAWLTIDVARGLRTAAP